MKNNKCLNCKDRHTGCHNTCENYKKYLEELDEKYKPKNKMELLKLIKEIVKILLKVHIGGLIMENKENQSTNETAQRIVNALQYVKEGFIEKDKIIKQSVLKSVVRVELKDILKNNTDYQSLSNALQQYIDKMF